MERKSSEIIRFLFVGASGAGGFIVIAWLLKTSIGISPFWSSTISYLVMISPVYLAQRAITFRSQVSHRSGVWRYATIQVAAMIIAATVSALLAPLVVSPIEFIVANLTSAIFSYFCMKFWAFEASKV